MRLRDVIVLAAVLWSGVCGARTPSAATDGASAAASAFASAPVPAPASASASASAVPPTSASTPASAIDARAVRAAASAVQADPLLPGMEKTKVLRLKKKAEAEKTRGKRDDFRWWRDLLDSLSAGLRVAMWLVGAGLLVWLLLRLRDLLQRQQAGRALATAPPTHVGTLDIRPESLPADIGGAARALWQRGETRAALSLLYRGALSRLVHGHGVPIRAASTERDCLALSATHLAPAAQTFLTQLVSGWQTVAYARRELSPEVFEHLCADFDARMATGAPT